MLFLEAGEEWNIDSRVPKIVPWFKCSIIFNIAFNFTKASMVLALKDSPKVEIS